MKGRSGWSAIAQYLAYLSSHRLSLPSREAEAGFSLNTNLKRSIAKTERTATTAPNLKEFFSYH
jgi:hypothetical protein